MSLKNLIALQKQGTTNAKSAHVDATPRSAVSAEVSPPASADASQPELVSQPDAVAPAAPAKVGLGLNVLKRGAGTGGKSLPANQANPAKPAARKPDAGSDSGSDDGAVFGLADLAGFDASEDTAPTRSALGERFDDEIEATAPERAITPDLTAQQMNFIESLDSIYPVLHDPDLFGQAVRIIMLEMQENPEYKKLISDQDVATMIRGMRNTMGLAKIRKQEKSRKAGGGGAAKRGRTSKSAVSDDDMALLNNLLGGGDLD